MPPRNWIDAREFAELAGVTERHARRMLQMALAKKSSQRGGIKVREVAGRGGRSGLRYEVALNSLSLDLQSAFYGYMEAASNPNALPAPVPAPGQGPKIEKRWRVIQEAIECPPRSAERKAEILRAARKWNIPVRTVYRWIANLERTGGDVNALAHKKPADAGERRVMVSRKFDRAFIAAGHPAELLAELAELVDQLIRAAWASRAQRAGWKQVRREAWTAFLRDLRGRGIDMMLPPSTVSQRRIVQSQHYRIVDIHDNDRKRFDDMSPRIRRDNSKFMPMEQIVMDVKPLDNIIRRPDGSTTWPKMIGFMDTGTHRLFRHFVLLEPGEGVRQEHVADAFIRMVMHPEWGLPQQLYRDNGTEFYILDMVRDALAMINEPGARTIVNAKPYSGASKPIESKFAVLDRFVFSQMDGWAGGNRMNKKTQTVGKPPAPYPGSFEQFVQEANERIEIFEHEEIGSGPFKGKSPQGCYAEHVANGWRPIALSPCALDAAFSKRETRRVDRGAVSIGGTFYRHPQLPNGETVEIAMPWRRGAEPLASIPGAGWAVLQPDMPFLPGQIDGAIERSRMKRADEARVRAMRKQAGGIDLAANRADRVVTLPTRAAPAPLMDVMASEQAREIAKAKAAGQAQITSQPSVEDARLAYARRQTENLKRQQRRG